MAQSGYTPISLYYSTTVSTAPLAANLVAGELALNTLDEKLYFKNSAGVVKLLASNAGSTGSVTSVGQSFTGGLISVAGSPITTSGTLALTVAGTSGGVPYFSSASTWASSATLNASALMIGGGAGAAPATTTTGTGVLTALGVNVGSAGAFVTFNGALGTPSSGTVTNLTGTASININGTVGATTANTGAFTTLSASSTVSGTGFSTYLASPPAIGGTAAAAGAFTSLTSTSASGILTRAAATQDGVELIGRAGGTTSLKVTFTPTALTASRTLTLPDNSGTLLTSGAVVTVAQGGTGLTTTPANGALDIGNGSGFTRATLTAGSGVTITNASGGITIAATGSGGTVTSVGLSAPAIFTVSGSPVTTSGTLTLSYSGTALPVANGGTGQTSYTDGQLLIGNTTGNTLAKATLSAGSGVTITNGSGTITIAATGSGGTVTSVGLTAPAMFTVTGSPVTGSGTLALTYSGTALPVANGGTGQTTGFKLFDATFTSSIDANVDRTAGMYGSYAAAATNTPTNSGILYNFMSGTGGAGDGGQFWQDYTTNNLYLRQRWGGTYGSWLTILSASNYNTYAPTLTGGNASGTWGININGTVGATTPAAGTFTNLAYTGTLTGSTGVIAIGTNQIYKDASGLVGIGTSSPAGKFEVAAGRSWFTANSELYSVAFRYSSSTGVMYMGATNSVGAPGIQFSKGTGVAVASIDDGGNIYTGLGTATLPSATTGISTGTQFGFKNKFINGNQVVFVNSALSGSGTGSVFKFAIDRWLAGASNAASPTYTAALSTALSQSPWPYVTCPIITITNNGASQEDLIFAQRIEANNITDLYGASITISFFCATSASSTVTWATYYPNTINTWNSAGPSAITNNATLIATGTFTTTSSLAYKTITTNAGTNAAGLGLMVLFTVTAAGGVSANITFGPLQLEKGTMATPFEFRAHSTELALCQRYYEVVGAQVLSSVPTAPYNGIPYRVQKRAAPSISYGQASGSGAVFSATSYSGGSVNYYIYQSTASSSANQGYVNISAEL